MASVFAISIKANQNGSVTLPNQNDQNDQDQNANGDLYRPMLKGQRTTFEIGQDDEGIHPEHIDGC